MITKNEAYRWTLDKEDKYWLLASIRKEIYNSILNGKFNCEWKSPAKYEVSDDEAVFLNSYFSNLKDMGYEISGGISDGHAVIYISWGKLN